MKRIFLLLMVFISLHVYAKGDDELMDAALLLWEEKSIHKLKKCSQNGNHYCTAFLAYEYYGDKMYSSAFPLLLSCSQRNVPMCNSFLGDMYANGEGVLQNDKKALHYYIKSAQLNMEAGAYNASVIYSNNALAFIYHTSPSGAAEYKYNIMRSYAWTKIALALGQKNNIKLNGEKEPLVKHFQEIKAIISKNGYLYEADKLASELCSTIPACMQ